MILDGTWHVVIDSPLGRQQGVLELRTQGGALHGTATAMGNTMEVRDGAVVGDLAEFSIEITRPVSIPLRVSVRVTGDAFAGEASGPMFGRRPVRGERAPA